MSNYQCDKMIIAIIQDDDYHEVIRDLNEGGFYVTVLRSSGGFLKKTNATIMIGLNHADLESALTILKRYGKRTEMEYNPATASVGMAVSSIAMPPVSIPVDCGGVVLFVLDVGRYERF